MQPYDMSNSYITVCRLGCSVSFVYERVRCNEDSSKIGNMCGERIYEGRPKSNGNWAAARR